MQTRRRDGQAVTGRMQLGVGQPRVPWRRLEGAAGGTVIVTVVVGRIEGQAKVGVAAVAA